MPGGIPGGGAPYLITGGGIDLGTPFFGASFFSNFFCLCFFFSSSNFAIFCSSSAEISRVSGILELELKFESCEIKYLVENTQYTRWTKIRRICPKPNSFRKYCYF